LQCYKKLLPIYHHGQWRIERAQFKAVSQTKIIQGTIDFLSFHHPIVTTYQCISCHRNFQRATDGRQHSRQFGQCHSCELKRVVNVNFRRKGNTLKPCYPTAEKRSELQKKERKEGEKVKDQEERRKGRTDIFWGNIVLLLRSWTTLMISNLTDSIILLMVITIMYQCFFFS
jgi:DNA-directed RNA polymerase subunit RPC12/RpoP